MSWQDNRVICEVSFDLPDLNITWFTFWQLVNKNTDKALSANKCKAIPLNARAKAFKNAKAEEFKNKLASQKKIK